MLEAGAGYGIERDEVRRQLWGRGPSPFTTSAKFAFYLFTFFIDLFVHFFYQASGVYVR